MLNNSSGPAPADDKVRAIRGAATPRLRPRTGQSAGAARKTLFYPSRPPGDLPAGWATAGLDDEVGAIVLTAATEPDELDFLLDRPGRDVLPLVTVGEAECGFADAHAETDTPDAIADALRRVAPIAERVAALPRRSALSIRPQTILLARLYTRASELVPVRDPASRCYVSYPVAGRLMGVAETANALAEKGKLNRRFFDRFHVCPECASARLNVREECHKCRSADLSEAGIIHHFSCAHEAPEADFLRGRDLLCPKCSKTLRHIGIDYDRPGSVQVCAACGCTDDTTAVGFLCIDCNRHHAAEAMAVRDWHSYAITPYGIQALLSGPEAEPDAAGVAGARGLSAFKVLLGQAVREAEHLQAPFTVLQVKFRAADRIRRQDRRLWTETVKLAGDALAAAVRPVDTTVAIENGMLVLMPRLRAEDTAPLGERVAEEMRRVLRVDPDTEIAPLDQDAVHRLLWEAR